MSNRTLIEINHDLAPSRININPQAFVDCLLEYLRTGDASRINGSFGIRVLGMFHHSTPLVVSVELRQ